MNKKFKIERSDIMLINAIFFVIMIPATFLTMLWLSIELAKAFEEFSE